MKPARESSLLIPPEAARAPARSHGAISPRKRYHLTLPEEPKPELGGTVAQLALLVVAVNVVACLIASRAMTVAEEPQVVAGVPSRTRPGAEHAAPSGGWLSTLTQPGRAAP